jgi:DNA polymerase IV
MERVALRVATVASRNLVGHPRRYFTDRSGRGQRADAAIPAACRTCRPRSPLFAAGMAGIVENLPVGKFHGVGPVTAAKMNKLGIHTGLDLKQQTRAFLMAQFGKAGDDFYHLARAEDDRPVVADHPRKSVGAETTFARDLLDWDEVAAALKPVFAKLWAAYNRHGPTARTVTVKIKFANFKQITRSQSCAEAITSRAILEQLSLDLLQPHFPPRRGVRLLGVSLSNFEAAPVAESRQTTLVLR